MLFFFRFKLQLNQVYFEKKKKNFVRIFLCGIILGNDGLTESACSYKNKDKSPRWPTCRINAFNFELYTCCIVRYSVPQWAFHLNSINSVLVYLDVCIAIIKFHVVHFSRSVNLLLKWDSTNQYSEINRCININVALTKFC